MPKISIIILNWNQPELTINTINSILKISHDQFEYKIILVDNGSTDNSCKLFHKFKQNVILLKNKENLGYAGGNNVGINYAINHDYDYILVANNDIRVDPKFLEIIYQEVKDNQKLIVAPKIYFEKGYEYFKNKYKKSDLGKIIWALGGKIDWQNIYGSNIAIDQVDQGQFDKNLSTPDFISGCCFLASASTFKDVGVLDERYYLYMEDVDFSIRATNRGYRLKIVPQSHIWHINSGTAGAASNFQDYFISRNRLLFANKFASFHTKLAIFRESIKLMIIGRKWQKIGIRDYYLSKFKKGSWV